MIPVPKYKPQCHRAFTVFLAFTDSLQYESCDSIVDLPLIVISRAISYNFIEKSIGQVPIRALRQEKYFCLYC